MNRDELTDLLCQNETLLYLQERWKDEREYEDFSLYEKKAKEIVPNLVRLTKQFHYFIETERGLEEFFFRGNALYSRRKIKN